MESKKKRDIYKEKDRAQGVQGFKATTIEGKAPDRAKTWTHAERIIVAKLCRIACLQFRDTATAGDDGWDLLFYTTYVERLGLDNGEDTSYIEDFHGQPLTKATGLLYGSNLVPDTSTERPEQTDIRQEVLIDILEACMSLKITAPKSEEGQRVLSDMTCGHQPDISYDSRARALLLSIAEYMQLTERDLLTVEKSVGQQLYFRLEDERQKTEGGCSDQTGTYRSNMDERALAAIESHEKKKKWMRWVATGAGVIGGGAIIGLTGGLAAPLVGGLVAGLTGTAFFATTGGIVLMTSMFGLTGGGLAGYKMHRRTKGLQDFSFKQLLKDDTLPMIPTLTTPWETYFASLKSDTDTYCLEFERTILLKLGSAFRTFLASEALKYAGIEVAKQTALSAFFAALALPGFLLKAADVIDNPWQIAFDRAHKAGLVLADVLEERVQGKRPVTLIGYSLGSEVIFTCLQELARRKQFGIIDSVVLLGAPVDGSHLPKWDAVSSVTAGKIINCFSASDFVLAVLHRLHSPTVNVAGLSPVKHWRVENVDINKLVSGHLNYKDRIRDILSHINFADAGDENTYRPQ